MRFSLRVHAILLPAVLISLTSQGASAGIISLSSFNLITTGNLTDNSDVQGRVLVGGTLNTNNFNFGGHLGGSILTPPGGIFNALAGNVTGLNNNGTNFIFGSGSPIGSQVANPVATAAYTTGLASYLASVSTGYAGLATNSTVNSTNLNLIQFTASPTTINGQSVAVFSVDQSFFTQTGTVSSLTGVTAATTVVINVTGGTPGNDTLSFGSINFGAFQNLSDQSNIIFNFENATSLTGIANLGGSILAANADLNSTNSLVGSVYVKSISNTGEIDQPHNNGTEVTGFGGFVPALVGVPEPASVVSMLVGLAIAGGASWRRLRQRAA
jgi:choice-of-anchor A domain-containing protein